MSIHVNHPREVTTEVQRGWGGWPMRAFRWATRRVLFRGVNDDAATMTSAGAQTADVPGEGLITSTNAI